MVSGYVLQIFSKNNRLLIKLKGEEMATYIVGDLHGCFDEFQLLLKKGTTILNKMNSL